MSKINVSDGSERIRRVNFSDVKKMYEDYMQYRDDIDLYIQSNDWSTLTDNQKDICIEMDLNVGDPATTKIVYLMSKGSSIEEATSILLNNAAINHRLESDSCKSRGYHPKMETVVFKYLALSDAADFFKLTQDLFTQYVSQAIRGTNDGSVGPGLFDFIESTSDYELNGLSAQGYTMLTGDVDAFIVELMNWFRDRL